jgi:hypothetical protein
MDERWKIGDLLEWRKSITYVILEDHPYDFRILVLRSPIYMPEFVQKTALLFAEAELICGL